MAEARLPGGRRGRAVFSVAFGITTAAFVACKPTSPDGAGMLVQQPADASASASSVPAAAPTKPTGPTAPSAPPLPSGGIGGDAGTCVCVKHRIEWGGTPCLCAVIGTTLRSCRTLETKTTTASLPLCTGPISCDPTVEGSGPAIERVFSHPDMVRALARAPLVFGRPNELREGSDGIRLAVDGKTLYIYESCKNSGDRPCEEAPPGVRAAVRYLAEQPIAHDPKSPCR